MKTVGRLNKESEGLIFLTGDGSFSRLLCDPQFGLGKTYRIVVRGSRGCSGCVCGGAAAAAEDDDDDDAGRQRLAGAVSDMIRRRDAAGVLPVEDCGGGPGAGRGMAEDEDHNNNTTIKQCMGEGGADNDGGDRQVAVSNVDKDRRRRRQAPEGEDNGGGLGQRFGRGSGKPHKMT
jgi:hypothetical protein